MERDVVERIYRFNRGRDPKLLKLKYQAMRSDVFTFFRGTCHLFYEDWPDSPLNEAPSVWVCGDLHLENFGSYKGDNRLVYFDINDFDEAALAPCTWDVTRFVTSVLVGSHTLQVDESNALGLCNCFLDAYISALAKGQARSVETETAEGLVEELLESLKERDRKDFLNQRTVEKKGKRRLLIDNKRTLPATEAQREKIAALIAAWAATQPEPKFFQMLDMAQRVAGTGSLGVGRYVLLIEGKGSPDRNYLLDLKQECESSLQPYLKLPQPQWASQAERVLEIQQRVQVTPPALLGVIMIDGESYVLRELQPLQDRVSLNAGNGKLGRLKKLMRTMGQVTAWNQLRSGGRQGSAIADDLIAFAKGQPSVLPTTYWRTALLNYAQAYSVQVEADYKDFCKTS